MKVKVVLNQTQIDSTDKMDLSQLSFKDVYAHYGTTRAVYKGSGRDKTISCRNGIATNVGDIEESVWCEVVKGLIVREHEEELFRHIKQWVKENTPHLKGEKELELEALKLHVMRIFDNPEWHGYVAFNSKYRPEILAQE